MQLGLPLVPRLPRATEFELPPAGAALLQRLLRTEEARVRAVLRKRTFAGPVCSLAFIYVWEHDLPTATYTYALTEQARDAAFERHGEQGLWVLWSPADWDHADILDDDPGQDVYREAERLAAALQEAGCEDPEGAFVCELAYRLARASWSGVMPITEDFACWAMEHESDEDALETFRVTALAAAVSAYAARGWLRFPDSYAIKP
jgi:hypothetical protein